MYYSDPSEFAKLILSVHIKLDHLRQLDYFSPNPYTLKGTVHLFG